MASGTQNLTTYKANILAHTPDDTSLFLRGDNVWTNILNGKLDLKNDLNLYTSSTDSPDIVWWYADKEQEQARIWMGSGSTSIFAPNYRCYKSDGTSLYSGNLVIGDGTGITNAASFRDKLSTWALISDSYNTFMPANGTTNSWYKFGTADGYGILPAVSGGAESGHSSIGTSSWYWKNLYVDRAYTGKITIQQPAAHRDNGIVGTYDYTKAAAIWSMGASYQIKADGSGLGTLYGAAYGYQGRDYLGSNTYAGGHQFLWCENGTVKVALGQNIWTAGKVTATGGYADRTNGTATYLNYGASGLAASAISWLTCWNGYELRAISKTETMVAVRGAASGSWAISVTGNAATATRINGNLAAATSNVSRNIWVSSTASADGIPNYISGFNMNPSTNVFMVPAGTRIFPNTGALYLGNSGNQNWVLTQDICSQSGAGDTYWSLRITGVAHFKTAYGAVWNDYAEMRNVPKAQIDIHRIYDDKGEIERNYPYAGHCVYEIGDGTMELTNARLAKGCKIISDTFGFCIGETKDCRTPIAVTGRVLAYPYENIEEYKNHIGDCVCSGPSGTISIMTLEETIQHPECIVGTISEIPTYAIWRCGNKDTKPINVNGRIWIYVR